VAAQWEGGDARPVGDGEGFVRFTADFSILKPVNADRGNRRIFFDYGNRGNKRMLQFFNDAPASNDPRTLAHAGNGFLMRRGYAVAWLAWQADLLPGNGRMLLDLPVARERSGPVTGLVRVEYIGKRSVIRSSTRLVISAPFCHSSSLAAAIIPPGCCTEMVASTLGRAAEPTRNLHMLSTELRGLQNFKLSSVTIRYLR